MSTSSSVANKIMIVGFSLGAALLTGGLSYIFYKYFKRDPMPTKWRRVGTLAQINLFPIKSCAPLILSPNDQVLCEILGLHYKGIKDRTLMLINENYEMVTARIYPKLVLVYSKIVEESKLLLTAEGMEPLELDFEKLADEGRGTSANTKVWGSKVEVMLCGEKYDKWFSNYLLGTDKGLHLVYYMFNVPVRSTNARLAKEPFITQQDSGRFGDATSYTLMNLSSVDDLNDHLHNVVIDPLQFRGNFHLKMDQNIPYAEEKWQWVRIGNDAIFRKVAPCTRCIFPNINVKTGERDPSGNPLKMLKSYRLLHDSVSPTLGIHLGLRQPGTIKAYDVIYVEDVE